MGQPGTWTAVRGSSRDGGDGRHHRVHPSAYRVRQCRAGPARQHRARLAYTSGRRTCRHKVKLGLAQTRHHHATRRGGVGAAAAGVVSVPVRWVAGRVDDHGRVLSQQRDQFGEGLEFGALLRQTFSPGEECVVPRRCVNAHVIPGACAHVIPQVVGPDDVLPCGLLVVICDTAGPLVRSVAGAVHEHLMAGVDQPIQQRFGDDGVGEQRVPVDR